MPSGGIGSFDNVIVLINRQELHSSYVKHVFANPFFNVVAALHAVVCGLNSDIMVKTASVWTRCTTVRSIWAPSFFAWIQPLCLSAAPNQLSSAVKKSHMSKLGLLFFFPPPRVQIHGAGGGTKTNRLIGS